jgi:hypothetical protein
MAEPFPAADGKDAEFFLTRTARIFTNESLGRGDRQYSGNTSAHSAIRLFTSKMFQVNSLCLMTCEQKTIDRILYVFYYVLEYYRNMRKGWWRANYENAHFEVGVFCNC